MNLLEDFTSGISRALQGGVVATAPAPASSSTTFTTGNDAVAAAEGFAAQARNAVKASFTSEVSKIEAMPHSQERLARASQVKNALDATAPWADSKLGSWDTYQGLLSRLRTLRNATMGTIGVSASGARVETDAAHERKHGNPLSAAAAGFVEGAGQGADRLGRMVDQLERVAPWVALAVGALIVLQVVRAVRA